LVGTEQEHHGLLLKAEARERKNKMKDSLLSLGAMKGPRPFLWISGKKIISYFPLKKSFITCFPGLTRLPKPLHFTFHISHSFAMAHE
jgi:hypothetical protein